MQEEFDFMKEKAMTELKKVVYGQKGPFTMLRDEAGHFHLELPGSRSTVYFLELPALRDLIDEVYRKEELSQRPKKACRHCGKMIAMHWLTCVTCYGKTCPACKGQVPDCPECKE